jgi:hypothetical protein
MKHNRILATCLIGLLALGAQSCLKSYVDYFDTSSAVRLATYLSDLDQMLGGEQYGWRMEYFVGNEDGDFGGINIALRFDADKGEVTAMSEEDETAAYTSHYVLTTDSGPVLAFDTYNPILHKYGTASSEYYEGRGGDYQFFIIGYDKEQKVVRLKGKRNGKLCTLYPLGESMETFNAKMYEYCRNFHVSTFDGFIDGNKVEGDFDINNHQITAREMEVYGQDESGNPKYDVAKTVSVPYIVTEKGIKFYEPLVLFGQSIEGFNFDFNLDSSDLKLSDPVSGVTLQSYIPEDWLPYDFYPGNYAFAYESGTINITLVPTGDRQTFRVKGMSRQFDLIAQYDVRTGRIGLRFQAVLVPDTDEAVVVDDRYLVVLLPWALGDGGSLWMNSELGLDAALKLSRDPMTGEVDMEQSLAKPVFNWIDCGAARNFHTDSFLLYLYDSDESADSPYAGSADDFSFTGGSYQLPYLKTLTKK